jgi:membrane-bound lytic murein transglycosylase B
MKPSRDIEPFERITAELGVDPGITPISCPMYRNGSQVGYGGAMGPAQFIPSTWVGYQDHLRSLLGHAPNPWDIRDAFLASALLLRDNGAAKGGGGNEEEEWKAALRYFSGSVNTRFRWYADQVLERATGFEEDIIAIQ